MRPGLYTFNYINDTHIIKWLELKKFGYDLTTGNRTKKELDGVEFLPLDRVLSESDILSFHLALNDQTISFLDDDLIFNPIESLPYSAVADIKIIQLI